MLQLRWRGWANGRATDAGGSGVAAAYDSSNLTVSILLLGAELRKPAGRMEGMVQGAASSEKLK